MRRAVENIKGTLLGSTGGRVCKVVLETFLVALEQVGFSQGSK